MDRATTHADIIIAGGGPVGMLLASELAGYGIDTLLLESKDATDDQPKAGTLHARSVQSLARRGYLKGPRPPAGIGPVTLPFHFAGITELSITTPATEPPPILKRSQADLERQFEATARARSARILRGYRVIEAGQSAHRAHVTAEGPDGPRTFSAAYLIGADGARSTVREQNDFSTDSRPPSVSAMVGLVRITAPDLLPRGWHRTPRGWIISRADADGYSLIRTLNCTGPRPDRHAPVTLGELRREVSWIAGHDVAMSDALSLTHFSDFTRLARQFHQGRIFLAGDSAHVHFPIGGQGLSTGLLDALNLSWKLAHTVRGTAGKGLLDTYDEERRPVALRLIDNTRAQLALMRSGPELDALRSVFAEVLATKDGGSLIGGMISAQETAYPARSGRPSEWEGRFLENMPLVTEDDGSTDAIELLRDGRPLLLLSAEASARLTTVAEGWSHVLRTVRVLSQSRSRLPWEALLVRPDGYIGWAADGGDLGEALSGWFGEGPSPGREAGPGHYRA